MSLHLRLMMLFRCMRTLVYSALLVSFPQLWIKRIGRAPGPRADQRDPGYLWIHALWLLNESLWVAAGCMGNELCSEKLGCSWPFSPNLSTWAWNNAILVCVQLSLADGNSCYLTHLGSSSPGESIAVMMEKCRFFPSWHWYWEIHH